MEAELKGMFSDLQSLEDSLPDPSHQALIDNVSLDGIRSRVKHLSTMEKLENVLRPRIKDMSAEVVDSNPYSRLMALRRMVIDNYKRIREFSIAKVPGFQAMTRATSCYPYVCLLWKRAMISDFQGCSLWV